jgi:Cellulase (glycosyl hydrolase family 5)
MQSPANLQAQPQSVLPQYHGYITVAPNKRYFQDEAGQGFIAIGENDAVSWPGLATLIGRLAPDTTEQYVADLRAHGVTVSRVMIEYAQQPSTYFENPVGTFARPMVEFWDDFIRLAEQHGLYLLLTPYDTFWQAKNWDSYPYNAALGGPCRTRLNWLTSPDCVAAQKGRWDFIIRRWGGSPNIFAWDLMNEIDIGWGASPREIEVYVTGMAAYVRELEQKYWGRTHLLTVSSAAPVPDGDLGKVIYNHPALDFANTHLYTGPGVRSPRNTVEGAQEIIDAVGKSLQAVSHTPRPYMDTETGPIDQWITDSDFDQEYHHNISWAHLASGAAGSGLRWPYTKPHWILPTLRGNLLALARFSAGIDWAHFDSRSIVPNVRVERPGIIKTGCADERTAILWLLRDTRVPDAPQLGGLTVELNDALDDGLYQVEMWETYRGRRFSEVLITVKDRKLTFTLPMFDLPLRDIAILIREVI